MPGSVGGHKGASSKRATVLSPKLSLCVEKGRRSPVGWQPQPHCTPAAPTRAGQEEPADSGPVLGGRQAVGGWAEPQGHRSERAGGEASKAGDREAGPPPCPLHPCPGLHSGGWPAGLRNTSFSKSGLVRVDSPAMKGPLRWPGHWGRRGSSFAFCAKNRGTWAPGATFTPRPGDISGERARFRPVKGEGTGLSCVVTTIPSAAQSTVIWDPLSMPATGTGGEGEGMSAPV